jgi:hypothetical protein
MSDCWHAIDIVSGTRIARIICEARVLERVALWPGIHETMARSLAFCIPTTLKKLTSGEKNALLRVPLL